MTKDTSEKMTAVYWCGLDEREISLLSVESCVPVDRRRNMSGARPYRHI